MKNGWMCSFVFLFASVYAENSSWNMTKNVSPLSYKAEFMIKKRGISLGKVVRTGLLTPRYYYDLYDRDNVLQMRGVTRAFSLGFLFSWGMEIDLYEGEDCAGKIEGRVLSSSRAKFAFYDALGRAVATAYLNDESSNFLLVSEQSEGNVFAELKGKAYGDASVWEMEFLNDPTVDEKALKIFAGFVSDYQKSFVRPPEKEIFYYYESKN